MGESRRKSLRRTKKKEINKKNKFFSPTFFDWLFVAFFTVFALVKCWSPLGFLSGGYRPGSTKARENKKQGKGKLEEGARRVQEGTAIEGPYIAP